MNLALGHLAFSCQLTRTLAPRSTWISAGRRTPDTCTASLQNFES